MSKKARKKQKLAAEAGNTGGGTRITQTDLLFGRRRPRRRLNVRFLVLLGLWIVALIIGLLYITGKL